MSDLAALEREILAAIAAAPDQPALEAVRVSALGRKGAISEELKKLGTLAPQERRDIQMIVALWRRRNRRRAAMDVQTLRRRPTRILGDRMVVSRHLLGNAPLRLSFRQRRHCRSSGPRRNRRLVFVAAAKADMGQPLQQRHPALLRMVVGLGVASCLTNLGLSWNRQLLELGHPRRTGRNPLSGLGDEGLRRRCRLHR